MVNLLSSYYVFNEPWCVRAVRKHLPPASRVTVLPFSFRDAAERPVSGPGSRHYGEIVRSLLAYGVGAADFTFCDYFADSRDTLLRKIGRADALFFTGGLPDRMMDRLAEKGLLEAIRSHRGLALGLSAGAMVQLGDYHITPDEDYPHFAYRRGLGLVSGFGIEVHYAGEPAQDEGIALFRQAFCLPVYAVANDGALLVEDGRVTALGNVRRIGAE